MSFAEQLRKIREEQETFSNTASLLAAQKLEQIQQQEKINLEKGKAFLEIGTTNFFPILQDFVSNYLQILSKPKVSDRWTAQLLSKYFSWNEKSCPTIEISAKPVGVSAEIIWDRTGDVNSYRRTQKRFSIHLNTENEVTLENFEVQNETIRIDQPDWVQRIENQILQCLTIGGIYEVIENEGCSDKGR